MWLRVERQGGRPEQPGTGNPQPRVPPRLLDNRLVEQRESEQVLLTLSFQLSARRGQLVKMLDRVARRVDKTIACCGLLKHQDGLIENVSEQVV